MRAIVYFWASFTLVISGITAGCASGGFKLTREYAQFVNRQQIVIRVVLYLLTSIVFAATLLIDMVIFNTVDFWEGRVSFGDYKFQNEGKMYHVRHEVMPNSHLKRSSIRISNTKEEVLQTVTLVETQAQTIELYIDGKLRTEVKNISSIPVAFIYSSSGVFLAQNRVPTDFTKVSAR